jgi:hypothetical protein
MPVDLVAVERKVHFLDSMSLSARPELGFRARGAAAEQNHVAWFHVTDSMRARS